MTVIRPPLVSEREGAHTYPTGAADDAKWEDCGPCSLLMAILAAHPELRSKMNANLHTEAEELRAAAGYGPLGGTVLHLLAAAAEKRYGITFGSIQSGATDATLKAAMVPGMSGAVTGLCGNFPVNHRLRRFAPLFTGGHVWFVSNEGADFWLIDPLGPNDGSYHGETITLTELLTFFSGTASFVISKTALVPPPPPEDQMPAITTYIPGQIATVKATSNIRSAPSTSAAIVRGNIPAAETWTVVGWVTGGVDAQTGSNQWLARVNAGKWEYTAKGNVTKIGPAPLPVDTTPFSQADVDAAAAKAKADLKAKIASL